MSKIVIGLGARRSATASDILAIVDETLAALPADLGDVVLLAGLEKPETHQALVEAARQLDLKTEFHALSVLRSYSHRCQTRSQRVLAALGVASIAEAAALASGHPNSGLLLPRIKHERATAAVAPAA